jgi:hypothetical protein
MRFPEGKGFFHDRLSAEARIGSKCSEMGLAVGW